jgi:hypothetical protein
MLQGEASLALMLQRWREGTMGCKIFAVVFAAVLLIGGGAFIFFESAAVLGEVAGGLIIAIIALAVGARLFRRSAG